MIVGPDGFAIEVRSLSKRYGRGAWALQDVDLAVPPGQTVALVGPNGAGKSSLIRALIGFETVQADKLLVHGADPRRQRGAVIRSVGYVPQGDCLFGELTVGQHMDMTRRLRSEFAPAVALERLDALGIAVSSRVGTLSGGQRAQVMLAIALATQAPTLLLDEPLASLDPLARRQFLRALPAATGGRVATVLLASHNVGDVEESCERLVVLGTGRVLLDADIAIARRSHRLLSGQVAETAADVIGRFAGPRGEIHALVREEGSDSAQEPTLEELVLGYLASNGHHGSERPAA
jgi:ABC-2 type transport system ATP-binding protein